MNPEADKRDVQCAALMGEKTVREDVVALLGSGLASGTVGLFC